MKRKKFTAVMMAAMIGVSAFPFNAMASSYKEYAKENVTKTIENFCQHYAKALDRGDSVENSSSIALSLSNEGSTLLNTLSSTDISWINSANISMSNSLKKDAAAQSANLYINGVKICTVNLLMDSKDSSVYINIPEVSDGYVKANLEDISSKNEDNGSTDSLHVNMQAADILENYFTAKETLPSADALQDILEKYSEIVIDKLPEGDSSKETVTAGNVSEEQDIVTTEIDQKAAADIMEAVYSSAKDDSGLKELFDSFSTDGYTYEDFIMSLDDMVTSLKGDTDKGDDGIIYDNDKSSDTEDTAPLETESIAEGGCYGETLEDASEFILKTYWNGQDIVGSQLAVETSLGEESVFKYQKTSDGDKNGFLFNVAGNEGITVEGSGTVSDDKLNGSYTLSANGEDVMQISIMDHDLSSWKDGNLKGIYTFTGTTEDLFDGMELKLSLDGSETRSECRASLSVHGTYLGALTLGSENKDSVIVPDKDSMEKIYDFTSESDINDFTDSMNMGTIMENLDKAGMPENWLYNLVGGTDSVPEVSEDFELKPAA